MPALQESSPPPTSVLTHDLQPPMDTVQAGTPVSAPQTAENPANLQAPSPTLDLPRPNSRRLSSTPQVERRPSTLSINRKSYVPNIPSPLNPSASTTSVSSSSDEAKSGFMGSTSPRDSSSSADIPSNGSGNTQNSVQENSGKSNLSTPQQLLRQKSAFIGLQLEEAQRPRFLSDLGRDYSRYPRSQSSLGSRGSGSVVPLLSSRMSDVSLPLTERNPFRDSIGSHVNIEKRSYPDDSIGAFDPYYGGEKGFILYSDEIEDDDDLHMPRDDDDKRFKTSWSDMLERRTLLRTIGGVLLVIGLLCLFILVPVLTFSTTLYPGASYNDTSYIDYGPAWAHVNNVRKFLPFILLLRASSFRTCYNTYPLLKNVRKSLVDPDTPSNVRTRKSTFDGSTLNLVFSDEFSRDGRTFYPGDDPFWTAPNIWYGATQDMEWYDPDAVTTGNGTLQLRLDAFPNHNLGYRSGMLNSWNQMCFKGGVMEVSISLPGPAGVPGLWPGAWSMGNLGRPGYKATTEGVWPYTYNECDLGITPNQSSPDGLSWLPGQKLASCSCKGADHPSPGTGRGAPEIDVIEASVDPTNRIGVVTQSFQVAPFDVWYRPNTDFLQIPNYETTNMNGYTGGPFQQAISGTTLLNNNWYDGHNYQKYAFEYIPGTSDGKIAWFVGEDQTFMMDGRAIGPNGNVGARQASEEPMSMVLNLGFSSAWGEILMGDLRFPTTMYVDYVRIYQREGQEMLTCDPPGYPTTQYIKDHPTAYMNPNLTAWNETGYDWPKNKLMGC
ncbi:glycoside hydrolase family 16 protein [Rutstroemia sp. NJR-2017a BBW]|nr:glycoside hydrolase family 16 protein [Rutstroemia sp. NJR-2017a BBW]